MNEPLVSVIVPIYRAERFLSRCLDSLIHQTYDKIEMILVDDGSPDASGSICEEYGQRDVRVRVIHQKNMGVSCARNKGLECAEGQFITFVDADDWLERNHIQNLVHGMRDCECSICGYWIERNGRSVWQAPHVESRLSPEAAAEQLLSPAGFQGSVCNKMFLLSILRREGMRFREDITYMEDLLFCSDYFHFCRAVFYTEQPTYHYRQHTESAVGDTRVSWEWLQRRTTAFKALDRVWCPSNMSVALCKARKQTEYMEILLKLVKAQTMQEEERQLTHTVRVGIGHVWASALPAKLKLKYMCVALCPRLYCRFSKRYGGAASVESGGQQ